MAGPNENGYVTALMVRSAVLCGGEDNTPEHAREAFIEAAREAGLSVFLGNDGPYF